MQRPTRVGRLIAFTTGPSANRHYFLRYLRLILVVCSVVAVEGRAVSAEVAPAFPVFTGNLKIALEAYAAIEKQGGWPTLANGPALRLGSSGFVVDRLKKRLLITKDLTEADTGTAVFDEAVDAAVRAFQARHGLAVDGVVGHETRDALNVPVTTRVKQIAANIDRLRSLAVTGEKSVILINVAAFQLTLLKEGRVVLTSPVIVGRQSRKTPIFSSAITRVTVNPYWRVPRRIATQDILPKAKRDPSYLDSQSIRVYQLSGQTWNEVPQDSIKWTSFSTNNFPFRLVQEPGPENALGRVKFFLPNDYDIFLHDTPARELFNHSRRTFSSGCIRVDKALELAEYLLRQDRHDGFHTMVEALESGETRQINLASPVPIHIAYLTAWVDQDRRVQFRDDIYALDGMKLAAAGGNATARTDVARAYDTAAVRACAAQSGGNGAHTAGFPPL